MNILLVYPKFPDTFWSFKHALAFINKKINNPPLGLMTVSAILPADWEKRLVDTNIQELKAADVLWADYVFISAMDVQRKSVNEIILFVKSHNKPIVAGGPLFTEDPGCFTDVDYFVLNEGEITIPKFVEDLQSNRPLQHIYRTESYADITLSPKPDISIIRMYDYDCMSIQFSRGCPFQCDFCNVTALLGHQPRTKTATQIIAELDQLYAAGWRRNVFFVDDNFIGNKKVIKSEILPALIEWRKGKTGCSFITEASINLADDNELLELMTQAGFFNVFIGIETPSKAGLEECNKKQNSTRDLLQSVRKIQNHGLQVMAGFIVGFDTDGPEIFDEMVEFIQQSGIITAMVGLLQAPYNTPLYSRLERENRLLKEMSGDNADGTTNIKTILEPALLRQGYFSIMKRIYSPEYLYPRIETFLREYQPKYSYAKLQWAEISAFLKTIFKMGFNPKEGRYYWRLLFKTLFHAPENFAAAITMTIYGYHFRTITALNMAAFNKEKPGILVSKPTGAWVKDQKVKNWVTPS